VKTNYRFSAPLSTLAITLWCLWVAVAGTNAVADVTEETSSPTTIKILAPTDAQKKAVKEIVRQLEYAHYRKQTIDDDLSSTILDNYINFLDEQKIYFISGDLKRFEPYRFLFDKALKRADLDPAFDIYNTFQQRVLERQQYALSLLEDGIKHFDFEKAESLDLERDNKPWADSTKALDDLWRKRIKHSILSQKLSDKTDEEIVKTLSRRFNTQLNRVKQGRSEDAFQTFMNVVTNVYDPHTQYMSPRSSENFKISMSLSLEGIGAVLQSENEFTKVVRLISGGPADKQGQLKPADRIVGVAQDKEDIVDVVGWRLEDVVALIRGTPRTLVKLEVIPAKAKTEADTNIISIVRDRVELEDQSARSEVIQLQRDGKDYNIGIIDLPTFYADFDAMSKGDPTYKSTTRDVKKIINNLKAEHRLDGLVIDLRNNGGGSLTEAIQLTGLFIKKGPAVQVRSLNNRVRIFDDKDATIAYQGPLAVLVNRMSASASEIFAAAIQDYGRGIIIGDQTFGKGTVQSVKPLSHGHLKITEAKFYRISGGSTQHKGVIPDITFPSPVDKTEIGEDALPEALPWDQISSVPHTRYGKLASIISKVQLQHDNRMVSHPEYQALLKEIEFLNSVKEQITVSLNKAARKAELAALREQELAYVNLRRLAQGEEIFKTYEQYDSYRSEQAALPESERDLDFVARESGEILVDLLRESPLIADNQT